MAEIKLKTLHQWRNDSWANTASKVTDIVLSKGEPYYIADYYNSGSTQSILIIGDGTSNMDTLLDNNSYFIRGKGAGYQLPTASTTEKGGIRLVSDKGISIGNTGLTWINTSSLIADENSCLTIDDTSKEDAYPGAGKLKVDLSLYEGNIEVNGQLVVNGDITADSLIEAPTMTGNLIKVRTDNTVALTNDDYVGLQIYNVHTDPIYLGAKKDGKLYYKNNINNFSIPVIPTSALSAAAPVLGINTDGELTKTTLSTVKIQVRDNDVEDYRDIGTINVTETNQTIQLTIPTKLSDLEDYSTGESYVTGADKELWRKMITEVAYSSSVDVPTLSSVQNYIESKVYDTQKLLLPQITLSAGEGLTTQEDGKVGLAPVTTTTDSNNRYPTESFTCISDIEVDDYGRVTKITKTTIYLT